MKAKITWDFRDTDYENFGQKIAVEALSLPIIVETDDICEDDDLHTCLEEVKNYMYENYGFEVKKLKLLED